MQATQRVSDGRINISSGSQFEKDYNYSRAVVVGGWILVSGTTGYDYTSGTLPAGASEQTAQLFRNVSAALAKAGAGLADVVRVRMYVSNPDHYEDIMRAYAKAFEGVNPACTTVEARLFDPEILVEMDMDAVAGA